MPRKPTCLRIKFQNWRNAQGGIERTKIEHKGQATYKNRSSDCKTPTLMQEFVRNEVDGKDKQKKHKRRQQKPKTARSNTHHTIMIKEFEPRRKTKRKNVR